MSNGNPLSQNKKSLRLYETKERPSAYRRQPYKASDVTNEVGHGRAEWLGLELYENRQFIALVELSSVGRSDNPKTKEKAAGFNQSLLHFHAFSIWKRRVREQKRTLGINQA